MRDGYEYMLAGDVSLNQGAKYGKKIYVYYSHGIKLVDAADYDEPVVDETEPENTPTTTEEDDDFGDWLDDNDLPYTVADGTDEGYDQIVDAIIAKLGVEHDEG